MILLQAATDNESFTRVTRHSGPSRQYKIMQLQLPLWLAAREWGVAAAPRKMRRHVTTSCASRHELGMPKEEGTDSDLQNGQSCVGIRLKHGERLQGLFPKHSGKVSAKHAETLPDGVAFAKTVSPVT